jgi:hypothetical protein
LDFHIDAVITYSLNNPSVIVLPRRDRIVVGFITTVPDLDKERPYANPLVRPLLIHHLHDWRKME